MADKKSTIDSKFNLYDEKLNKNEMIQLSISLVGNYIKSISKYRLSNEAKKLFTIVANDFLIKLIDDILETKNQQNIHIINPEDVYASLNKLNFGCFIDDLKVECNNAKQSNKNRKRLCNSVKESGLPVEELIRQQQELIAAARIQQKKVLEEESKKLHISSDKE